MFHTLPRPLQVFWRLFIQIYLIILYYTVYITASGIADTAGKLTRMLQKIKNKVFSSSTLSKNMIYHCGEGEEVSTPILIYTG